jgi:sphingosine kinase
LEIHVIPSCPHLTIDPPQRRYKVIINPVSGKGKALEIFRKQVMPILQAAGCNVVAQDPNTPDNPQVHHVTHFVETTAKGDAEIIARGLSLKCYDGIMCIGGDGTVHEVINGLANRPDGDKALKSIAIATIPAGNALFCDLLTSRIRYTPRLSD